MTLFVSCLLWGTRPVGSCALEPVSWTSRIMSWDDLANGTVSTMSHGGRSFASRMSAGMIWGQSTDTDLLRDDSLLDTDGAIRVCPSDLVGAITFG